MKNMTLFSLNKASFCARTDVRTPARPYACLYARLRARPYARTYTRMQTRALAHTPVRTPARTPVRPYVRPYVHPYSGTRAGTHTRTSGYVHAGANVVSSCSACQLNKAKSTTKAVSLFRRQVCGWKTMGVSQECSNALRSKRSRPTNLPRRIKPTSSRSHGGGRQALT